MRSTKSHIKYKPIRIIADFAIKSLKAVRAWNNVFQALKKK
jgi:hypothetical protein